MSIRKITLENGKYVITSDSSKTAVMLAYCDGKPIYNYDDLPLFRSLFEMAWDASHEECNDGSWSVDESEEEQEDLPEFYVPKSLRKPKTRSEVSYAIGWSEVSYAIGWKEKKFRMDTESSNLKDLLNIIPSDDEEDEDPDYIMRYNKDGSDELLYFWNYTDNTWERYK